MKIHKNLKWWAALFVLIALAAASCTKGIDTIDRPVPFEYEMTDSTLTVYHIGEFYMLYYSPEVFDIGWGEYDWDEFHTGPVCPDEFGRKRTVIELDDRTIIRMSTRDWEYITTIEELK